MGSEPRRWAPILDAGIDVQVREDLITESDIQHAASALAIADHYNPNDYVASEWAGIRLDYEDMARTVLSVVLGPDAQS